jgi:periplasmic protein TonB
MNTAVAEIEKPHRTTATSVLNLELPKDAPEPSKPTRRVGEYKRHSLAARYWGDISQSKQPMRQVARAEAEAVFLRGLLETPTDHRRKNPTDWVISLALHVLIVSAVVIAPLAFTQGIDLRAFQLTHLTVPKPPAAAPPPPPAAVEQALKQAMRPIQSALLAPSLIPRRIETIKDPPAPDAEPLGVIGGIPGGETGGVLGGILGGGPRGPVAPAAPPPAAKKSVYRVGGDVKPPRAVKVVQPSYSPVARTAQIQGVVVIEAIIDEHGNVVEAHAVSGPGLLIPAALKAVTQWKYEPTYLDGQPVAMELEVQVEFHLQ